MLDRETSILSRASPLLTCRLRDRSHSTLEKSAYTRAPEAGSSIFSITSIHGMYRTTLPAADSGSSSTHLGVNTAENLSWSSNDENSLPACCIVSTSGVGRCGG